MSDRSVVTNAERPRLLARILSKCEEDGDCLIWQGGCSCGGQPIISFRSGCRYVRGLMYEAHHGVLPPEGKLLAPSCRNSLCVSPGCIVAMTVQALRRLDARRGAYSRPAANATRLLLARRRATIPEDVVQRCREFEGTCAQASMATGVSLSHIKKIRAGTARRPLVSVWAGLQVAKK